MTDEYQNIRLNIEDRVGRISFARPPLNVFNIARMREINDAIGECAGQPEIKLGVFPPVAAVLLPRIIGDKRARELILTGELIDAAEALRLGLVSRVVPSAELEQKTRDVLVKLRELSAPALEASKRAMNLARGRTFEDALSAVEDLYLNELMKTEDAREGIQAFMEKRKPEWKSK